MVDQLVAVDEAAVALGVSRATVWNWVRRYELQTFRVPGERRTLLKRSDVERLRQPIPVEEAKKAAA